MQKSTVFAICLVVSMGLLGCASKPTQVQLSPQQTVLKSGEIQSKKGDFVVRVIKAGQPGVDFSSIYKYGLPIYVAVANGSGQQINFSPNHVQVYKNDKYVPQLTAYDITQKFDKKNTSNKILTGLQTAFVMTMAIAGASGQTDPQLQTSLANHAGSTLESTFNSYDKQKTFNAEVGSALSQRLKDTTLPEAVILPNKAVAGHVYFDGLKDSDPIRIEIYTGSVKHVIHYK